MKDKRILLDRIKAKFYNSYEKMYKVESQKISNLTAQIQETINKNYNRNYESFVNLVGKLEELNPLRILMRGYAIVKKDAEIINSIGKIKTGDIVKVIMSDGKINCKVKDVEKNET